MDVIPTEHEECVVFVEWLRLHKIPVIHIPNEGRRSYAMGKQLKRIGLAKGVPDYFIPLMRKGFGGLFIEMKRKKGSVVSHEQQDWILQLNKNGYRSVITYGADEAIEVMNQYLKGN